MATSQKQAHQFLIFSLTSELQAMVPTEHLGEVLRCDMDQVVPIFDVHHAVMGVCSKRTEVLWLVDLPYLLELSPPYASGSHQFCNAMIIQQEGQIAGFTVPNIGQLLPCQDSQIRSASLKSFPRQLRRCVSGLYRLPKGLDILILDTAKIFDLLKTHSPPN